MPQEKFCLRWNDFQSNISSAFRDLWEDTDFIDVTLVCGEEQLQAHRVILAACSPFFKTILKKNPHPQPLLYLKGIGMEEMKALLNFMYYGEVNVAEDKLDTFLAVAAEVQVKGLTQEAGEPPRGCVEPQCATEAAYGTGEQSTGVLNNNLKTEPQKVEDSISKMESQDYLVGEEGENLEKVQQFHYENNKGCAGESRSVLTKCVVRRETNWQCKICGKKDKQKDHLIEHVEAAHYPFVFENKCPYCEKKNRSRASLRSHIYCHHKGIPKM